MKLTNAYEGVKKLFTSEILNLISQLCLFLAGIGAVITLASLTIEEDTVEIQSAAAGGGIMMVIFLFAAGVLTIIAVILKLLGMRTAGADEKDFSDGFILAVFALILTLVSSALSSINGGNNVFDDIATALASLLQIGAMMYVTRGIVKLAYRMNNQKVANMGNRIFILYSVILFVGIILRVVSAFFYGPSVITTAAAVILLLSGIVSAVAYILYVVFLGKAKKMLQ